MSDLIQKAIDHIDNESEKSDDPIVKAIAQYIIDECLISDEAAQKILNKGLSLSKCSAAVKNKAKKQAVNGCACIKDCVVFNWVREYYGLSKSSESAKPKLIRANFDTPSLLELM